MVHAVARHHVEVHELCSCGLTIKDKKATFAMALMISDPELRKRDITGFYDNPHASSPYPQNSNSLDRKPQKRILKNCDKDMEVRHPKTEVF